MKINVSGIKYREQAWLDRNMAFPWHLISPGDTVTIKPDPYGKVMHTQHNDPYAMAIIHDKSGTWLGFAPHKKAKEIHEKLVKGFSLAWAKVRAISDEGGGSLDGRGISIELEFG